MDDGIKKALTFAFAVTGLFIFYWVLMVKINVMAQQTQAKIQKMSSDLTWEDFLYKKTADSIIEQKKSQGSGGVDSNTGLK